MTPWLGQRVLERALERPSSDEELLQTTPWLGQWVLERVREWALEWERALE
jgi:hypothetical protein